MANAHNVIIRGLNAIIQQAPYVRDSNDPRYKAQDVKDLLFYVDAWTKMVNHHHAVEESFMFPDLKKFSGNPSLMDEAQHQHELFHDGLERLLAYCSTTKPEEYRWEGSGGMKEIIDSFSKHLTDHLYAEIDEFLNMKDLDDVGLRKTWDRAEDVAKQTGNIGMLVSPAYIRNTFLTLLDFSLTKSSTMCFLASLDVRIILSKVGMLSLHCLGYCPT